MKFACIQLALVLLIKLLLTIYRFSSSVSPLLTIEFTQECFLKPIKHTVEQF